MCVYIYILTIESLYLASCMSKDYLNNFKLTFDLPSDIVLKTHFSSVYIIIELAVSCHSEVQITLLNVRLMAVLLFGVVTNAGVGDLNL